MIATMFFVSLSLDPRKAVGNQFYADRAQAEAAQLEANKWARTDIFKVREATVSVGIPKEDGVSGKTEDNPSQKSGFNDPVPDMSLRSINTALRSGKKRPL